MKKDNTHILNTFVISDVKPADNSGIKKRE
jgi:hypothetical protein